MERISGTVVFFSYLLAALLSGCASAPTETAVDPQIRENAIFNCKREIEAKKKAQFMKLPTLLQRLAGENQVLREFDRPPTKSEIQRAIARFPLAGDSGGTWRNAHDAHLRTIATRFVSRPSPARGVSASDAASTVDVPKPEVISMVVGQPGRTFSFPISQLKPLASGGLQGASQTDRLTIGVLDEHHLLIQATSSR